MTATSNRFVRGALASLLISTALTPSPVAAESALDPQAVQRLQDSMDFLADQKTFSLETDTTIEVVLENGQKLQFANAIEATVQRPNRMHAERLGELVNQEFFYDGETLTLHDGAAGFFARLEAPDTLEGMLDFARDSLDIVAPAGDFIYSNAFELLMDGVNSAMYVGPGYVEGKVCDHLAFRNTASATDWQIWIERGDTPLPRRIVITSTDLPNAPQFSVHFRDWELSPDVDADDFLFDAHDENVEIEFIVINAGGSQ